jgi:cell division protein FtsI (penicillin-binding protein 3)
VKGLPNRRLRLLLLIFVLVFGGTFLRAAWLQGVRAASLSGMATAQHQEKITIPAGRGAILDRNGVQLAIGEQGTTVFANPLQVRNPRSEASVAARILGVDPNPLAVSLADRSHGFVYVARKADPKRAAQLMARKLSGFASYAEERRAYPQNAVASQVLGFAGVDNHGLAGLELQLDKTLSGTAGKETVVKDAYGRVLDVLKSSPEKQGHDVYLTIDHTIQSNAEAVLRDTIREFHAKDATAVVLDPRTGGVLAMAVAPGYDANRYPDVPRWAQRNRAVTDTYEPGSTFKLVTIAAALSEGIVTPDTRFTLPYSIQVADRVVHDAEPRGTETMTVAEILARSSNVGAITIAKLLGQQRLGQWITRFGFGRSTGIDFPGESPGIVLPVDMWSGSTIGNVPIGQGIAVTPIQMASAYAAIAQGGVWRQPHIVDHVGLEPRPHMKTRRIVSAEMARELRTMLKNVVLDGTGTSAAVPGYEVAGKTGTAQKPGPHGYTTGKYVASFVGFVPASRPRLVILVSVDEPATVIWGGSVAAPAFQKIATFDLQYLEVPPDAPETATSASTG